MNEQLPVVSFRPEGRDQFMALMTLMVGVGVEITYLKHRVGWDPAGHEVEFQEMDTKRGEIVSINDQLIELRPYGLPRYYSKNQYRNYEVAWEDVKMLEVTG